MILFFSPGISYLYRNSQNVSKIWTPALENKVMHIFLSLEIEFAAALHFWFISEGGNTSKKAF